jgi:flagellar basal-body rod protein FlgF
MTGERKMSYDVSDVAIAGARKLTQLDFVANNIANAVTSGFKSEHLYYAMTGKQAQESARLDLGPTSTRMDFAQGTLETTGNNLDMAIEGDGFFVIQKKSGSAYTRNGSFLLNKNKELVTSAGDYVLGENGHIVIEGSSFQIDGEGTIQVDGNSVGKLKIVTFASPGELTRAQSGQYIDAGKAGQKKANNYRVSNGHLEMSNVSATKEMIDMIDIQRSFEAYQKIMQTMQDLDKISTSRIGKLI